jgi:hypothetical protein
VTELTPTAYQEGAACDAPVLAAIGIGWNAAGMHHIDPPHVSTFIGPHPEDDDFVITVTAFE